MPVVLFNPKMPGFFCTRPYVLGILLRGGSNTEEGLESVLLNLKLLFFSRTQFLKKFGQKSSMFCYFGCFKQCINVKYSII